jgi:hypothetical protein
MTLLSGHIKRTKIIAVLDKLTDDVEDAYNGVMDRIYAQDEERRKIAITALKWITYSKERLNVDELLHAIELGLDPECKDIDNDDLVDLDQLLSCCAGLLILNIKDGTIQLFHYTTQDFLKTRFLKADAHTSLAKFCLTYLTLDAFSDPPEEERKLRSVMRTYPLCSYAARYWGYHSRLGLETNIVAAILSTLSNQKKRDMMANIEEFHLGYGQSRRRTVLHLTARYGLYEACCTILNHQLALSSSN